MHRRYRYVILLSAVLLQACLGATYSWSIFAGALRDHLGLRQATAQLPFTMFYTVFPATLIFSSLLLRRLGPQTCAVIGGVIFGSGWIVASLGRLHFAWTAAGIGVMGGIGVGFAYIVPIAIGMLWFPDNKGLVTGVAVAGFAGGAALVSNIASHLIAEHGWTAFEAFRLFGVIFATVAACAGVLMRYPPDAGARPVSTEKAALILRDRRFRVLYVAMFVALAAGFTVIANLKQLLPGVDARTGAIAVGSLAIANAVGRIVWGFAFDRLLSSAAVRLNLLCQACVLLAAPLLIRSPKGLLVLAVCAGFNYGGVLVLYASSCAHCWGPQRVSQAYGWLFSANIPASLVPLLAGKSLDEWATFVPALLTLGGALLAATLLTPTRLAPAAALPVSES